MAPVLHGERAESLRASDGVEPNRKCLSWGTTGDSLLRTWELNSEGDKEPLKNVKGGVSDSPLTSYVAAGESSPLCELSVFMDKIGIDTDLLGQWKRTTQE